jgi:hypothetical protein
MDPRDLHDDDQLLLVLGEVLDADDPVPADALALALSAAELGDLDAEMAELVFDSLLDDRAVALRAGGDSEVRSLTFAAGDRTIEVDLANDDLVGRVAPPGAPGADPLVLGVVQAGRRQEVTTDSLGRFRSTVGPGPLRLVFSDAEAGSLLVTPWITR